MLLVWLMTASLTGDAQSSPDATVEARGPIVSLSTNSCHLERARPVDLSMVIRDYARLRGDCVAVRGWNRGRSIYRSLDDAQYGGASATVGRPTGLGLYGDDKAAKSFSAEPRPVVAAGIVGACEVINQGEGSAGYCHSIIEGAVLILGELRPQR